MGKASRTKGAIEWRPVTSCDGKFAERYEVSNTGQVRAAAYCRVPGSKPGRVLFQGRDNKGYPHVYLHYGKRKKQTLKVHRLVAEAFLEERRPGMTVDHVDGNKENNSVDNLEYVTREENYRRARVMGLCRPVEKAWNKHVGQKINMQIARDIRLRVSLGERRQVIADEHGIHVMTVGEIVRGEIWAE